MNRCLNENEINYVLSHLGMTMDTSVFTSLFHYDAAISTSDSIYVLPHEGEVSISKVNNTPIPFSSDSDFLYSIDKKGNLVFHQDLLKCAFYLLSGYDEHFVNEERDHWGRVKYEGSIQKKMEIIGRPIVNEYFDIIFNGINAFCQRHNKPTIHKKKIFNTFGFLLSHDIDTIDKYGWHHLGFKIKEFLGLVKTKLSKFDLIKELIISKIQFVNPWRVNPHWNFDYLIQQEKKHHIHASYYFLSKDKNGGSRYQFNERRLKQLFKQLKEEGHEIGIHGTTNTISQKEKLSIQIDELSKYADLTIEGGRQHRLWLNLSTTFKQHEQAGLKYDTTFGFAEHEGFRNSYCLPFKPYDFENQKSIDVWQFPLMSMDVTLFHYRNLKNVEILDRINSMIQEVKNYNGIFTLLWHNSFFDETLYPGVTKMFESILESISTQQPVALTGKELVELLDEQAL